MNYVAWIVLFGLWVSSADADCVNNDIFPSPRWAVALGWHVSLKDAGRIDAYAKAVYRMIDRIYTVESGKMVNSDLRFSSFYETIINDPENFQRYSGTRDEYVTEIHLRQALFGVKTAGQKGKTSPPVEVDFLREAVSTEAVSKWRPTEWLGTFPAVVINKAPGGRLREYFIYAEDAGDFLADEVAFEKGQLLALGDQSIGFDVEFLTKEGAHSSEKFASIQDVLSQLQSCKPSLCGAFMRIRRYWSYMQFIEKYAVADRITNINRLNQVFVWDEKSVKSANALSLYSLTRDAFAVIGASFRVDGDDIVVDRFVTVPMAPGFH